MKMKISEISDLINIRNYIQTSINNFSIKKESVKELDKSLILLDRLLVEELTGEKFKQKINFENADSAIQEIISLRPKAGK